VTGDYSADALRYEDEWRRDKERAAARASRPRQEPLPFDDSYLDDDELVVEIHGTGLGIRRHAAANEPMCAACKTWVAELVKDGFAQRVEEGTR